MAGRLQKQAISHEYVHVLVMLALSVSNSFSMHW